MPTDRNAGSLNRRMSSQRLPLTRSREEIVRQDVEDALAATPAERIEAMIALLDSAYELWATRGLDRDEGLCRFPRITQQRRRGLCRQDLWNGRTEGEFLGVPTAFAGVDELIRMKRATGDAEKDLPDVQRLQALRAGRPTHES
jgi:hypothetical protein